MIAELTKIYNDIVIDSLSKQREIYSIIKDYYGENLVDYEENFKEPLCIEEVIYKIKNYFNINGGTPSNFLRLLLITDECSRKFNSTLNTNYSILDILEDLYSSESLFNKGIFSNMPKNYTYTTEKEKIKALELIYKDFTNILQSSKSEPFIIPKSNHIFIKFPKVTVTNENARSHDILDVYIRLTLGYNSIINSFAIARGTLTEDEYRSSYGFSHASGNLTTFSPSICLGSGPIAQTRAELAMSMSTYNPHKIQLFCYELEKYLQVESLTGGPYNHLESIGNTNNNLITNFNADYFKNLEVNRFIQCNLSTNLKEFFIYLVDNKLQDFKFKYTGKQVVIGLNFSEIVQVITNSYIDWVLSQKMNLTDLPDSIKTYLQYVYISNAGVYIINNRRNITSIPESFSTLCRFKGEVISTKIIKNDQNSAPVYIFNLAYTKRFILELTTYINKYYHE